MIQRVRSRLLVLAAVFALVTGVLVALIQREGIAMGSGGQVFALALGAFVLALVAGLVTMELMRRPMRELAHQTRNVVRDTSRRVSILERIRATSSTSSRSG